MRAGLLLYASTFQHSTRNLGCDWKDLVDAVQEFFADNKLVWSVNCTTITLVPEVKLPIYRPMSCCYLLFKIISKVLANKIKTVFSDNL